MLIRTFNQAEQYLNLHIPKNHKEKFPGQLGLKRTEDFLKLLGSPQDKLKVIHIAGTSGKGSTCYLISRLLASHGFKVGLHLSPHLTDVRERFQIYNKVVSKKEFVFYLNKLMPSINSSLSYFEVLVGLAFYIFSDKKVDYAVIETGLGGWYDGTNVVSHQDKVCVLTKIGYDHTEILGRTLAEIGLQKAMIIKKNNLVVSIKQDREVEKVIRVVAKKNQAELHFVDSSTLPTKSGSLGMTEKVGLIGYYQKENASLALKTVELVAKRDGFKVDKEKVRAVFKTSHFPGRFDVKNINGKTVVFDGAHNPQKMEAFTNALKERYPKQRFHFLLAFKKGKDYFSMLKSIIPLASEITLTSFFVDNQDLVHLSEKPEEIGRRLEIKRFRDYEIVADPKKAFQSVLKAKEKTIIVTGSLYLLGEIYRIIK